MAVIVTSHCAQYWVTKIKNKSKTMNHRKAQKDRFDFKSKTHHQLGFKYICVVCHQIINNMKTHCLKRTFRSGKPISEELNSHLNNWLPSPENWFCHCSCPAGCFQSRWRPKSLGSLRARSLRWERSCVGKLQRKNTPNKKVLLTRRNQVNTSIY